MRRGDSTSSGWTRGNGGPEAIISSRWLGASGGGCPSARPCGNAARRRQGSRRCRVALSRRGGRGRISDHGGVGSLWRARRGRSMLGNTRRCSGSFCRARAAPGGYGKKQSKSNVGGRKNSPRPGRQSSVVTVAVTRATNLPEGAERSSILIRGLCVRKSRKPKEAKGSPPKTALSGWGTSPLKPTPGILSLIHI